MLSLFGKRHKTCVPFAEQLEVLARCGIRLRPGIAAERLLASFPREEYENNPYQLLLTTMGGEAEDGAHERLSDNLWHFDAECIADHGDYVQIAQRLACLAQGSLPMEDIQDFVDVDRGEAWVSFRFKGEEYRWDATVQDDWVDEEIIARFVKLMVEQKAGRRFTYLDLGGQDFLMGCSTPQELEMLREQTGLKLRWL